LEKRKSTTVQLILRQNLFYSAHCVYLHWCCKLERSAALLSLIRGAIDLVTSSAKLVMDPQSIAVPVVAEEVVVVLQALDFFLISFIQVAAWQFSGLQCTRSEQHNYMQVEEEDLDFKLLPLVTLEACYPNRQP
jgi:hypothetical protein